MRLLAPLALVFALAACQKAESSSAVKVDEATATMQVTAPAPAATAPVADSGDHACGCGMGGGNGCAECGGGCQMDMEEAAAPAGAAPLPAGTRWTAMTVDGMHCGGCARRIEKALTGVQGIAAVDVDLTTHTVKVAALPNTDARAIAAPKIDALGYHVE